MHRLRSRGFTLIEILVVVVVIGIIATGAVLAISTLGRDRDMENESARMVALLDYAREQAELQTRELGLFCQERGYEFLYFDPRRGIWDVIQDDEAFRARKLPDGLRMRLVVEAREVQLNKPKVTEERMPHLMVFSNGDLTSFEMTLSREGTDRRQIIAVDPKGLITSVDPDEKKK